MTASVRQVNVSDQYQLDATVGSFVVQGFVLANRTPYSATMIKRKEFNVVWAVVGFFLCLLPLLIYCIIYAGESDQVVEIRLAASVGLAGPFPALPAPSPLQLSPDGHHWWDGQAWRAAAEAAPPGAPRSPDGGFWWDGRGWRPVPAPH